MESGTKFPRRALSDKIKLEWPNNQRHDSKTLLAFRCCRISSRPGKDERPFTTLSLCRFRLYAPAARAKEVRAGVEPATSSLPRKCSTALSYQTKGPGLVYGRRLHGSGPNSPQPG